MVKVLTALDTIESIKKEETKIRDVYVGYNKLPEDTQAILTSLKLDYHGLQSLYMTLKSTREFYERNLGQKEIECDWCH